jgi:hypothetical protein
MFMAVLYMSPLNTKHEMTAYRITCRKKLTAGFFRESKCKVCCRLWRARCFPPAIAASAEEEWLEPGARRIY